MNILSIKETCIYVEDLERTKAFYSDKLGLPLISYVKDRHIFFSAGTSVLLCFLAEATKKEKELPHHGAKGQIHFAFETTSEEYLKALIHIKAAGICILQEHSWKNGWHSLYFHDPDNNLVEIIEQGLWEL